MQFAAPLRNNTALGTKRHESTSDISGFKLLGNKLNNFVDGTFTPNPDESKLATRVASSDLASSM